MKNSVTALVVVSFAALLASGLVAQREVRAAESPGIEKNAADALEKLYAKEPGAKILGQNALAFYGMKDGVKPGIQTRMQTGKGTRVESGMKAGAEAR